MVQHYAVFKTGKAVMKKTWKEGASRDSNDKVLQISQHP
jgi:hypothetical protein